MGLSGSATNIGQIPKIAEIEDLSEMLALLSNSKKYQERLEHLATVQNAINDSLKQYEEHQSVEALRDSAQTAMTQLRLKKKENDEVLENIKQEREQFVELKQKTERDQENRKKSLDEQDRQLKLEKIEFNNNKRPTEELNARLKKEAADLAQQAKTMMAEAKDMKATYEQKLTDLKKVMG